MLKKLRLENFGKFVNTEFDLGPVTVFLGDNESGKTTVYDALFDILCEPRGNRKEGRELKERYGDGRKACLEPESALVRIDPSEFRNLYAIRAADVTLEMGDSSRWIERVKAKLFSGGIDPQMIKKELERRASERGNLSHNIRLKQLKEDKEKAEGKLKALHDERHRILDGERLARMLKEEIGEKASRLEGLDEKLAEMNGQIALEEKIEQRKRLGQILDFLSEGERLRRDPQALSSIEEMRRRAGLAAKMSKEIAGFQAEPPMLTRSAWNWALIAAAVLVFAAGGAGAALVGPTGAQIALVLCAGLAAMVLAFLSRRTVIERDEGAYLQFLQRLAGEWEGATAERAECTTLGDWHDFVDNQRIKYQQLVDDLEEWEAKLRQHLNEQQCSDEKKLQRECDRKLRSLDEEGIPEKGRSQAELGALRRCRKQTFADRSELDAGLRDLEKKSSGKSGEVRGALRNLPEQIVQAESRVRQIDREIAENELERKAAALAAQIFAEITLDSDAGLEELGAELGILLEELTGTGRTVDIPSLSTNLARMTDAGGTERPIEQLSSGTRDCFLFAAKLTLARKGASGKALLVLDEPFILFDEPRREKALRVLKKFREETGWQMIILTKDRSLGDAIRRTFEAREIIEHALVAASPQSR